MCCLNKPQVIKSSALQQLNRCLGDKQSSLLTWMWCNVICACGCRGCSSARGGKLIFNSRKVSLISVSSDLGCVGAAQGRWLPPPSVMGEGVCVCVLVCVSVFMFLICVCPWVCLCMYGGFTTACFVCVSEFILILCVWSVQVTEKINLSNKSFF